MHWAEVTDQNKTEFQSNLSLIRKVGFVLVD